MLAGAVYGTALTLNDEPLGLAWRGFAHRCWGGMTPAHVGKHQATGAADFGCIVPLCAAAHLFYDLHRKAWAKITGWTEKKMASAASGYALRYVERGGVWCTSGTRRGSLDS
jgi:hypothetical protein